MTSPIHGATGAGNSRIVPPDEVIYDFSKHLPETDRDQRMLDVLDKNGNNKLTALEMTGMSGQTQASRFDGIYIETGIHINPADSNKDGKIGYEEERTAAIDAAMQAGPYGHMDGKPMYLNPVYAEYYNIDYAGAKDKIFPDVTPLAQSQMPTPAEPQHNFLSDLPAFDYSRVDDDAREEFLKQLKRITEPLPEDGGSRAFSESSLAFINPRTNPGGV